MADTKRKVGSEGATEESNQDIENLVDDVLDSPSLPPKSTLEKEDKGLESEEDSSDPEEEEEESQEEETVSEENKEGEEEQEEKEEESENSEEDVVPASKHKKALEKMQKRIDQLTAEREAARDKEQAAAKTQEQKLQALSDSELSDLADNVDDAIIDAKVTAKTDGTDMTERLTELRNLKRSIDATRKTAPQRFQQKQVKHFQDMAEAVKDIDPQVMEGKGEMVEIAKNIYSKSRSLQNSETGQAEALALAAEYYVEKQSLSKGSERASTLQRKVSNLKKKTSLDGKRHVANSDQISRRKIRDKAVSGTYDDKLDFIKKTLVPDEFINVR